MTVQFAYALVNVSVTRNANAPEFSQTEYLVDNLLEKTPVGTNIVNVTATDSDQVKSGIFRCAFYAVAYLLTIDDMSLQVEDTRVVSVYLFRCLLTLCFPIWFILF